MAIIDVFTYNGEIDLFEIHYNILKDYVDEFIVVEFDKTFSGREKPFYGAELDKRFSSWQDKIRYNYLTEQTYGKYRDLADRSPNTLGVEHWKTEFMMKESIKDCLTHLKDDDIVFIGDCDEIWFPGFEWYLPKRPIKLKLAVYTYYLNNRSDEVFWGTLATEYKDIKNECLNHLRTASEGSVVMMGWHFTSLKDGLKRKLEDSYTEETYASPHIMENLDQNIKENKDFLGRPFKYWTDESDWPQYLKDNREKYAHLCK